MYSGAGQKDSLPSPSSCSTHTCISIHNNNNNNNRASAQQVNSDGEVEAGIEMR